VSSTLKQVKQGIYGVTFEVELNKKSTSYEYFESLKSEIT